MAQGSANNRTIETPSSLNDLSDVDTSGVAENEVLTFDGSSWISAPKQTFGGWPSFGDEFIEWDGDASGMTTVTVSGTQSVVESVNSLSVDYEDQTAADMNCLLTAHSFSVGDSFVVPVRIWERTLESFAFGTLLFTNGTASTSAAVAACFYLQSAGAPILESRSGTLTALSTAATTLTMSVQASSQVVYLKVTYTASNSFTMEYGPNGIAFPVSQNMTPTLTPTHVGVGWSSWGGLTDNIRVNTFGPIRKVA